MRRLPQPAQTANSPLRQAIRQVFTRPILTGSMLLVLAPAGQSLTLGDISVRSTLGQRLDATVPVRLGAGEALASGCVVPGRKTSELRTVPGADVTTPQAIGEGLYELQVTSAAALYEPMYELELKVQCPGAPVLIRQYVLMLDLPTAVASGVPAAYEAAVTPAPATSARDSNEGAAALPTGSPGAQRRSAAREPGSTIEAGVLYRVADGDTLSSIAARVRSRTVSLWTLAGAIQAANPEAFIRNDANLIKLGSEILIPATMAASTPTETASAAAEPLEAPLSIPAPLPVAPPVLATEAAGPVEPPQALVEAPRPAASTAPVPRSTTVPKQTAPVVADVAEPSPVFAAGAGILFGLCISAVLWVRGRRPSRKRAAAKAAPDAESPSPFATTALATAITTAPAALVTRSLEPAFSVSYTPPADDSLAPEFPSAEVTSELEELFDSTDTTIQKRLNAEKTMAARSLGNELPDEYAPHLAKPGSAVDFLVGDPPDEDYASQSGTVDMHALAAAATKDQQQAQNLLEALTLLERDYEEELTASQVLDMSAVRQALGSDPDEPTQIRDTHIREASARKRAG